MNRILLVILAVILILSIFAYGCTDHTDNITGYILYPATINDIDIWADNSSTLHYFVDVCIGEHTSCDDFDSYNVTRTGNTTIRLEIVNKHINGVPCEEYMRYVEHTFPLGSGFSPGVNYTVEINAVTVNFVVDGITIYPAPIKAASIYHDRSMPPEYHVGVVTEEYSICDSFYSYNVTRNDSTTIILDIFNRKCCTGSPDPAPEESEYEYFFDYHRIPLGSDFVTGVNYTVAINDVIRTFVA